MKQRNNINQRRLFKNTHTYDITKKSQSLYKHMNKKDGFDSGIVSKGNLIPATSQMRSSQEPSE